MTRPIRESSLERTSSSHDHRISQLERRPAPKFEIAAVYHIKVRSNRQRMIIRDDEFTWAIEEDIDGMRLLRVEIDVTTAGSDVTEVKLRNIDNGDVAMLSTHAFIDAGETHSRTAATQPVVNGSGADVVHGDRIAIDIVDNGGGDALGLGLVAVFEAPA